MEVVFILLPLAILVAGVMLGFFVWGVRSGQFDDLETPALRVLFDDEPASGPAEGRKRSESSVQSDEEGEQLP